MGRKILFITTDQQRYDALGCNGGTIARTPVVDRLAAAGVNFRRAHNQNVVCMPARSTMLTGQYVRTHGVLANGVALPPDAPSVAAHLHEHGYRTALLGKAHFEPAMDLRGKWFENRMGRRGLDRAVPRLRAHGAGDARAARGLALLGLHPARAPGGRERLRAAALGRGRRRDRRAGGGIQPDSARVVPHRLGGRPYHRVARLAAGRCRLVLLDELSRPASSVGSTRVGGAAACRGATWTCRPATRAHPTRSSRS